MDHLWENVLLPGNMELFGALRYAAVAEKADLGNVRKDLIKYVVVARLALPVISQLSTADQLLINAVAINKISAQLDNLHPLRLGIAPGTIPPLTPVPTTCPPGQSWACCAKALPITPLEGREGWNWRY